MGKGKSSVRYHFLDEVRGFAVVCMVFYHAFYLLGYLFNVEAAKTFYYFFMPAEPFYAGAFIFISGIASCLSHSNLIRGFKLLGVALAINLVTYLAGFFGLQVDIQFGILNLLSVCMILAALFLPIVKKIPPVITLTAAAVLVVLTYGVESGYFGFGPFQYGISDSVKAVPWLFPVGIHDANFYSADYFPLLPWSFVFLGGMAAGVYAIRGKFPKFMKNQHVRPLAYVGRHALIVYILHQPILYGIALAVSKLMGLFR